jgi:hypothetical protein
MPLSVDASRSRAWVWQVGRSTSWSPTPLRHRSFIALRESRAKASAASC